MLLQYQVLYQIADKDTQVTAHRVVGATILMNAITTWGAVLTLLQNGRPFWTDHSAEWSIHHLVANIYMSPHTLNDNVTREYSYRHTMANLHGS